MIIKDYCYDSIQFLYAVPFSKIGPIAAGSVAALYMGGIPAALAVLACCSGYELVSGRCRKSISELRKGALYKDIVDWCARYCHQEHRAEIQAKLYERVTEAGTLDLHGMRLQHLPPFLKDLHISMLNVQSNQLEQLPELPSSLQTLDCSSNRIRELPNLPLALQELDCSSNRIRELPNLPPTLQQLNCSSNRISELPALPGSLQILDCVEMNLTELPNFPPNLIGLFCSVNEIRQLPNLPPALQELHCERNQITSLPDLPPNLRVLDCRNNLLRELPNQPLNLADFFYSGNPIEEDRLQRNVPAANPLAFLREWNIPDTTGQQVLQGFDPEHLRLLQTFVRQLGESPFLRHSPEGRECFRKILQDVLNLAVADRVFKVHFIEYLGEYTTSCVDRAATGLILIEISMRFFKAQNPDEKLKIAIGIEKCEILIAAGLEIAAANHNQDEEIETVLALLIQMREQHNLPFSLDRMKFPRCAALTAENIEQAATKLSDFTHWDLYQKSTLWQHFLQENNKDEFEKFNAEWSQKLESTSESNDQTLLEGIKTVQTDRAKALRTLIEQMTWKICPSARSFPPTEERKELEQKEDL